MASDYKRGTYGNFNMTVFSIDTCTYVVEDTKNNKALGRERASKVIQVFNYTLRI